MPGASDLVDAFLADIFRLIAQPSPHAFGQAKNFRVIGFSFSAGGTKTWKTDRDYYFRGLFSQSGAAFTATLDNSGVFMDGTSKQKDSGLLWAQTTSSSQPFPGEIRTFLPQNTIVYIHTGAASGCCMLLQDV